MNIAQIRKAIVAGVGAGVTAFWSLAGGGITAEEAGAVAAAAVATAFATYWIPNKEAA